MTPHTPTVAHARQARTLISFLFVAALLCAAVVAPRAPIAAEPRANVAAVSAPEFELKDQHDRTHAYRFPRDKVSVLAFGDREGSEQLESWIRPLVDRYDERIDIDGVAVLAGVPRVARPVVRRVMRGKVARAVMLDWTGEVARGYGYEQGKATLVVLARDGSVVARTSGAADAGKLRGLYAAVDRLLRDGR